MTSPQPQSLENPFKIPGLFIGGLLCVQALILLASLEFPLEVFVALIGAACFYYLLKNPFAGLCAFILLHFLVLRSTEGIDLGEVVFALYFFAYLGVWFFRKIFIQRERILVSYVDYALAGFLFMCLFSIVPAFLVGSELFKWLRELLPLLTLLYIFPIRDELHTKMRIKIIIACFLVLGVTVAINNLILYREALSGITYFFEVASSRQHANEPILMAIVVFAGTVLIFYRSFANQMLSLLLLIIFSGALAITFSRGYWLGAFAGAVFLLLIAPTRIKIRMVALTSIFSLITFVIAFEFFGDFAELVFSSLGERLTSIGSAGTDLSFANRLREWSAVLSQIKTNPVIGYGLGMIYKYKAIIPLEMPTWYVHNTILFIWYKIGLIGLIFLLVFEVGILLGTIKAFIVSDSIFSKTLLAGLASCLFAIYTVSMTSPQFIENDSALLATLVCGIARCNYFEYYRNNADG